MACRVAYIHTNMSWQGYVDTNLVGTGKVSKAAIIGLKGGVWAASPGFTVGSLSLACLRPAQLSAEEQQAVIKGLDDPTPLQASGIYANGKKYLTLQANPRSIYGKSGVRTTPLTFRATACASSRPTRPYWSVHTSPRCSPATPTRSWRDWQTI